jgi:hypothetical protein
MKLTLCPSCHRHVRPTEIACPFCDANVEDMSKAGLGAAVVLGLGLAVAGCSSSSDPRTVSPAYMACTTCGYEDAGSDGAEKDAATRDAAVTDSSTHDSGRGVAPAYMPCTTCGEADAARRD